MKSDHSWLLSRLTHNGDAPHAGGAPTRALSTMFLIGESAGRVAWCYQVSVANVEDAIRIEYALRHRQKWAIAWQAKAKTEALAKRRTTRRVKKTAKKGHRHV